MRVLFVIFGILSHLVMLFCSVGVIIKDTGIRNYSSFELALMGIDKGDATTGMMASLIVLLAGIFGIVGLFMKKRTLVFASAGTVLVFSVLSWILQPNIKSFLVSGTLPKEVALVGMICGLIAAGCILGAFFTRKEPVVHQPFNPNQPYGSGNQPPYGGSNQPPYGGANQPPYGGQNQPPYPRTSQSNHIIAPPPINSGNTEPPAIPGGGPENTATTEPPAVPGVNPNPPQA